MPRGGDSEEDVISVRILGQTENCREGGTTFLSLAVIAIFAQPRTFLQFCTAVVMQVGQMTEETVAVVSNRVGDCAPSLRGDAAYVTFALDRCLRSPMT